MALIIPAHGQLAAIGFDHRFAIHKPLTMKGNQRRAGARPAGQGQARAALEDFQTDIVTGPHLGETGIDPFGEERVMLDARADLYDGQGQDILDREDHMGVAHADSARAFKALATGQVHAEIKPHGLHGQG